MTLAEYDRRKGYAGEMKGYLANARRPAIEGTDGQWSRKDYKRMNDAFCAAVRNSPEGRELCRQEAERALQQRWATLWGTPFVLVRYARSAFPTNHHEAVRHERFQPIMNRECERFGVSEIDVKSERRTRNVIEPRHVIMWRARRETVMSLPEIGRRLGGRDHTTVLCAARKIDGQVRAMLAQGGPLPDWAYESLERVPLTENAQ